MNVHPLGIALLCALVSVSACKKTETIAVPALSQSRITEFKVTNTADGAIYGAINDAEKTISVIVPYYYFLTSLQTEVKVSEGATVSGPEEGIIQKLDSLLLTEKVADYTVTGKDGSKTIYTLHVDTKQQQIEAEEVSADAATPAVWYSSQVFSESPYTYTKQYDITVRNLAVSSTQSPKVFLINEAGQAYKPLGAHIDSYNPVSNSFKIRVSMAFGDVVPAGSYTIRIDNYSKTLTLKNKIRVDTNRIY